MRFQLAIMENRRSDHTGAAQQRMSLVHPSAPQALCKADCYLSTCFEPGSCKGHCLQGCAMSNWAFNQPNCSLASPPEGPGGLLNTSVCAGRTPTHSPAHTCCLLPAMWRRGAVAARSRAAWATPCGRRRERAHSAPCRAVPSEPGGGGPFARLFSHPPSSLGSIGGPGRGRGVQLVAFAARRCWLSWSQRRRDTT